MGSARIVLEKISAIPPRLIHRIRRGLLAVYVEVDSGDYFIGDNDLELYFEAREKYPDTVFHLIRIGHKAAHRL